MSKKLQLANKQSNQILIDTNLLLLLFIGLFDKKLISTFKYTREKFIPEDFDELAKFIRNFSTIVTTPHILTETSLWCEKVTGEKGDAFLSFFAERITVLNEIFEPSQKITQTEAFKKFGLTDGAIYCISLKHIPVLTIDWDLAGYLDKKKIQTYNFNNLRYYLFN